MCSLIIEVNSETRATHRNTGTKVIVKRVQLDPNNDRSSRLDDALERGFVYSFETIRAERGRGRSVSPERCLFIVLPDPTKLSGEVATLKQLVESGNLTESRKSLLFKNLVVCLDNLHNSGCAHLSIDMDSVWIEELFYVYLGPFRLTKQVSSIHQAFLPPERVLSDSSLSDETLPKADIWAVGLLWCCLRFGKSFCHELSKVHNAEEYLVFLDLLLGLSNTPRLSYIPQYSWQNIKLLLSKAQDATALDKEFLRRCSKELEKHELVKEMLSLHPDNRLSPRAILCFDLFRDSAIGDQSDTLSLQTSYLIDKDKPILAELNDHNDRLAASHGDRGTKLQSKEEIHRNYPTKVMEESNKGSKRLSNTIPEHREQKHLDKIENNNQQSHLLESRKQRYAIQDAKSELPEASNKYIESVSDAREVRRQSREALARQESTDYNRQKKISSVSNGSHKEFDNKKVEAEHTIDGRSARRPRDSDKKPLSPIIQSRSDHFNLPEEREVDESSIEKARERRRLLERQYIDNRDSSHTPDKAYLAQKRPESEYKPQVFEQIESGTRTHNYTRTPPSEERSIPISTNQLQSRSYRSPQATYSGKELTSDSTATLGQKDQSPPLASNYSSLPNQPIYQASDSKRRERRARHDLSPTPHKEDPTQTISAPKSRTPVLIQPPQPTAQPLVQPLQPQSNQLAMTLTTRNCQLLTTQPTTTLATLTLSLSTPSNPRAVSGQCGEMVRLHCPVDTAGEGGLGVDCSVYLARGSGATPRFYASARIDLQPLYLAAIHLQGDSEVKEEKWIGLRDASREICVLVNVDIRIMRGGMQQANNISGSREPRNGIDERKKVEIMVNDSAKSFQADDAYTEPLRSRQNRRQNERSDSLENSKNGTPLRHAPEASIPRPELLPNYPQRVEVHPPSAPQPPSSQVIRPSFSFGKIPPRSQTDTLKAEISKLASSVYSSSPKEISLGQSLSALRSILASVHTS